VAAHVARSFGSTSCRTCCRTRSSGNAFGCTYAQHRPGWRTPYM
jgi:hypothetical protein